MTAARTIWHLSRDGSSDRRELVVTIPNRVISESNARGHWAKKARRVKDQRHTVGLVVSGLLSVEGAIGFPCTVMLTRIAPSKGLDGDNLQASLKAVRDGVADALRVDDGAPWITWHYDQRRGKPKEWAVEIRIVRERN